MLSATGRPALLRSISAYPLPHVNAWACIVSFHVCAVMSALLDGVTFSNGYAG